MKSLKLWLRLEALESNPTTARINMLKTLCQRGVIGVLCLSAWGRLPAQAQRAEVPIVAVQLSDGTMRCAVPIMVGRRQVLAGLDTGSAGLQLLPAAQHDLQPMEETFRGSYGSGVLLTGHAAQAEVGIGTLHGVVVANQVVDVSCVPTKPECGGSRVPLAEFGILGDGLPREGFAALLGLRTQRDPKPGHPLNPLVQLGVTRWIIALPQPNVGGEGHLILNPTEADLAGFISVPSGAATGEVQACIDRPAPAQTHVCGSALLDTGAPGISVSGAAVSTQARPGALAHISFGASEKPSLTIEIRLNERLQMSHYRVADDGIGQQAPLRLGPLPYLVFDVLYDSANASISMRPRQSYPGGPTLLVPGGVH